MIFSRWNKEKKDEIEKQMHVILTRFPDDELKPSKVRKVLRCVDKNTRFSYHDLLTYEQFYWMNKYVTFPIPYVEAKYFERFMKVKEDLNHLFGFKELRSQMEEMNDALYQKVDEYVQIEETRLTDNLMNLFSDTPWEACTFWDDYSTGWLKRFEVEKISVLKKKNERFNQLKDLLHVFRYTEHEPILLEALKKEAKTIAV